MRPPTRESFRQTALRLSGALPQTTGAVWQSDLVGVKPEQPPRKAAGRLLRAVRSELFVYGLDFKRLRCVLLLV